MPQNNEPAHLKTGKAAEKAALEYLSNQGCEILTTNYNARYGELDIIMRDRQDLVFVEVRYRKNDDFGGAIESIHAKKQEKIRRAAEQFLQENPDLLFRGCRFDVILLTNKAQNYQYDWITAAF